MGTVTTLDFAKLTLRDAMDLAQLIEEEARDRYGELADSLSLHRTPDAAKFFSRMQHIEELHRAKLEAERKKLFGNETVTVCREQIFDVEAPEYDQVRAGMSVRAALEVAMVSEKKAHDFFASALTRITDPKVRELFEELRDEEVEHQQLVQKEIDKLAPGSDQTTGDDDEPVAQ